MLNIHGDNTDLRIQEYHSSSWDHHHLISANENHLKSCDVTVESNSTSVQKPVYLVQYKMSVYFYWQRHEQSDYFKVYIPLSFSGITYYKSSNSENIFLFSELA